MIMTPKKADVRKWMLLTRDDNRLTGQEPSRWRPWEVQEGVLPMPTESMRDVAHEALSVASARSQERQFEPLTSPAAFYVDDLVAGQVLTLDDGTVLWLAKENDEVNIPGIGLGSAYSFTKSHIVARHGSKKSKQAFPYARLAQTQGS